MNGEIRWAFITYNRTCSDGNGRRSVVHGAVGSSQDGDGVKQHTTTEQGAAAEKGNLVGELAGNGS